MYNEPSVDFQDGKVGVYLGLDDKYYSEPRSGPIDPRRLMLVSDRYRPLYHFVAPANRMNDPNGAIYWKGDYHLFYQYDPNGTSPGKRSWGHASSKDLVHWKDLPIALTPTLGGPDHRACFSGGVVDNDGVPTIVYFGVGDGICIATSDDDMLIWEKSPHNPVIPAPKGGEEWKTHDPCAWKDGNYWYLVSGSNVGAPPRDIGSSRDAAFMFRSPDLINWDYMRPLYEPGDESDCAVPDFFQLGDKHMLLFASHTRGAQYYIGAYADQRFTPEIHGRMNFTTFGPLGKDMHISGDLIAPISWESPDGRRIMIAWISEGRTKEVEETSGWSGIMSLPRVLSLTDGGILQIEPLPELEVLRRERRSFTNLSIKAGSSTDLKEVRGDCLELVVEFEYSDYGEVGIKVCCSPDGSEETVVTYIYAEQSLELDVGRSSLSSDVVGSTTQRTHLELGPDEPLKLRVFVDRSVVEVFANDRECLTKRIYPTRPDSLGVQVFAMGNDASLRSLDAWQMSSIWPFGHE